MKVLTIKQPFATLIAEGLKTYEFRSWKTKYRGYILIHAGKSIDQKAMKQFEHLNLNYPTGCIIAKATITDCIWIDDRKRDELKKLNSLVYSSIIEQTGWEGYGFQLKNIQKIDPIRINGKLSFWEYDYKDE